MRVLGGTAGWREVKSGFGTLPNMFVIAVIARQAGQRKQVQTEYQAKESHRGQR